MRAGLANISVKKLAVNLGRPLAQVLEALKVMGLAAHAHPDAFVPVEHLQALQEILQNPGGGPDFEKLMTSLGVEPLEASSPPPAKPRGATPTKPPQEDGVGGQSQGLETRGKPSAAQTSAAHKAETRLAQAQAELAQVKAELETREQERRTVETELAALREQLSTGRNQLADVHSRINDLEADLEVPGRADATLLALLETQGIHGRDESMRAISSLMSNRRLEGVVGDLLMQRPDRLVRLLQNHMLLHCGRQDCPPPTSCATVVVSQERCEICGGTGLKGPLETFANALLLRGWTRVGIQGGRPLLLRHLQAHLDTRIQLTFLGEGPLPKKRSFQLLIRWMDEAGDCSIRHLDIPPSEHTLSSLLRRSAVQVSRC